MDFHSLISALRGAKIVENAMREAGWVWESGPIGLGELVVVQRIVALEDAVRASPLVVVCVCGACTDHQAPVAHIAFSASLHERIASEVFHLGVRLVRELSPLGIAVEVCSSP